MPPSPPAATVDDLGLVGALYLAALVDTAHWRLRVAPTRRMTLVVMNTLHELGLIEVPWPAPRWEVAPDARETPIEGLQWRLSWTAYQPDRLGEALHDFLDDVPRDDYATALRLRLWRELAVAEGERYFEFQLGKHQLDPSWAQDLVFVQRDLNLDLSAAQWRYCCWAATRCGAALAQQLRVPNPAAVREAIYADLRRRTGPVASGQWGGAQFVPFNPQPDSALTAIFTKHLTRLGDAFWTLVPSDVALLMPAPARQAR
jgi:hypothetical protein